MPSCRSFLTSPGGRVPNLEIHSGCALPGLASSNNYHFEYSINQNKSPADNQIQPARKSTVWIGPIQIIKSMSKSLNVQYVYSEPRARNVTEAKPNHVSCPSSPTTQCLFF